MTWGSGIGQRGVLTRVAVAGRVEPAVCSDRRGLWHQTPGAAWAVPRVIWRRERHCFTPRCFSHPQNRYGIHFTGSLWGLTSVRSAEWFISQCLSHEVLRSANMLAVVLPAIMPHNSTWSVLGVQWTIAILFKVDQTHFYLAIKTIPAFRFNGNSLKSLWFSGKVLKPSFLNSYPGTTTY